MFGFDSVLRDEYDTIKEIKTLAKICDEWDNYKRILPAIITQCNIKDVQICTEHKPTELNKIMSCKKCKGTGYVITYNKEETSNES